MCYRWEKTHGLLIEGGLTYEAITKSVSDAAIAFREGVVELFEYLEVLSKPSLANTIFRNFFGTCLDTLLCSVWIKISNNFTMSL